MKKKTTYYLIEGTIALLVIVFLATYTVPYFIEAQNVNTPYYFPDSKFRSIVETCMEVEPGGKFTRHDVEQKIKQIEIKGPNVKTIQGIELLMGLQWLICEETQFTQADLRSNTELVNIFIENTHSISEILLPESDNLQVVSIEFEDLSELNVPSLPNLKVLQCNGNQLRSLDVSKCPNLTLLSVSNNRIDKLVVSLDNQIDTIYCNDNNLTKLELLKLQHLKTLYCMRNPIVELDIAKAPALEKLYVSYSSIRDVSGYLSHTSLSNVKVYYDSKDNFESEYGSEITRTLRKRFGVSQYRGEGFEISEPRH